MKANELMIGDWVLNDLGESQQIVEIRKDCAILAYGDSFAYDEIEPISLTPEILEKNGFVKQGFEGWEIDHKNNDGIMDWMVLWRNDCIRPHLLIKSFVSLLGSFSSFGINYVHELQRALRLCGIEKEITL